MECDYMNNIFMYFSSILIIISFIGYFLMNIFDVRKVTNSSGFDIIKDIISEYDYLSFVKL